MTPIEAAKAMRKSAAQEAMTCTARDGGVGNFAALSLTRVTDLLAKAERALQPFACGCGDECEIGNISSCSHRRARATLEEIRKGIE